MAVSIRGVVTILLPGTGSDDDYLRRALSGPLERAGACVITVAPDPDRLVDGFVQALEVASRDCARIAVGGVSLGAALAVNWAIAHPESTAAVVAALPPWTGDPGSAPAAWSARYTAALLRRDGLEKTTATMRASSPPWLADELARSWRRQWPALPAAMDAAAAYVGPTEAELRGLQTPLAVVAAADDPLHPATVAAEWASWAPHAALATVRLDNFGPNPTALGAACVEALRSIR